MNEFLKMDIFFVVATVATVFVSMLVCMALYYLVRFLATINRIGEEIEEETGAIRADIEETRHKVRREGLRFTHLVSFFKKTASRVTPKKKRKS